MRINQKQISEWSENPVTLELLKLVNEEIDNVVLTPSASCLHYGEPFKTQDNLVTQDVKVYVFAVLKLALEGDWEYFDDE